MWLVKIIYTVGACVQPSFGRTGQWRAEKVPGQHFVPTECRWQNPRTLRDQLKDPLALSWSGSWEAIEGGGGLFRLPHQQFRQLLSPKSVVASLRSGQVSPWLTEETDEGSTVAQCVFQWVPVRPPEL